MISGNNFALLNARTLAELAAKIRTLMNTTEAARSTPPSHSVARVDANLGRALSGLERHQNNLLSGRSLHSSPFAYRLRSLFGLTNHGAGSSYALRSLQHGPDTALARLRSTSEATDIEGVNRVMLRNQSGDQITIRSGAELDIKELTGSFEKLFKNYDGKNIQIELPALTAANSREMSLALGAAYRRAVNKSGTKILPEHIVLPEDIDQDAFLRSYRIQQVVYQRLYPNTQRHTGLDTDQATISEAVRGHQARFAEMMDDIEALDIAADVSDPAMNVFFADRERTDFLNSVFVRYDLDRPIRAPQSRDVFEARKSDIVNQFADIKFELINKKAIDKSKFDAAANALRRFNVFKDWTDAEFIAFVRKNPTNLNITVRNTVPTDNPANIISIDQRTTINNFISIVKAQAQTGQTLCIHFTRGSVYMPSEVASSVGNLINNLRRDSRLSGLTNDIQIIYSIPDGSSELDTLNRIAGYTHDPNTFPANQLSAINRWLPYEGNPASHL